ncbi:S41 family peptidase [Aestuariibacter sp. AA17]|uniref:S41 family peptidase n=1 Tax=Fluctibacter corallii TaxID=2984329 RepID=A0ABT3A4R6_9ALTE|nr:S41 family peptidase [Aestuariibacter sp. AA17]MCV2883675.1 S41 family peptidase [Aestuariibacter sp. AA17]
MKTVSILLLLSLLGLSAFVLHQKQSFDGAKAYSELKQALDEHYAYLDSAERNVAELTETFRSALVDADSQHSFIDKAQQYVKLFRDPHLNLGPYDENDISVYPTGADVYVTYENGNARVIDTKSGSAAHEANILPGDLILGIDEHSIDEAIFEVAGVDSERLSNGQRDYALNVALGGKRYQPRQFIIEQQGEKRTVSLAAGYDSINALNDGPAVSFKRLNNIGYIRFNNGLGNQQTVSGFHSALEQLTGVEAFIIDMRNTPSGGNTGVAEPILGHFVKEPTAYQQYKVQTGGKSYGDADMQQAIVTPTSPFISQPFVVLAGRWTGSMGEGMTIAFDALGAKAVIGAPMADLLGGIKRVELPTSGAWLEVGFERLYHINGTFREDFEPDILLSAADITQSGEDEALLVAINLLSEAL